MLDSGTPTDPLGLTTAKPKKQLCHGQLYDSCIPYSSHIEECCHSCIVSPYTKYMCIIQHQSLGIM